MCSDLYSEFDGKLFVNCLCICIVKTRVVSWHECLSSNSLAACGIFGFAPRRNADPAESKS